MWKLTIEDDEGKRTPLPLARDEYAIGRGEDNTIRLTERNISRKHAQLRRSGTGWLVSDISSYNGSYVNGIRLASEHILAHNDIIQVGDYRLEFVDEDVLSKASESANAATLPGGGNAGVKPDRLVVVVGPMPGEEFLIQEVSISIGRAPELQICLPHTSVSRLHAEVHALGGGRYEVIDKASANGVRVNGSLLKRGLLEAGDFIELGEVKLKFVGAGQAYRPGPEAVRLESPGTELSTVRPPPMSSPVAGATSAIDTFMAEAGGRSKFLKNLAIGAGAGLIAVIALFSLRRGAGHDAAPTATPAPKAAPSSAPIDPTQAALAEAKKAAAAGNFDLAHNKLAVEIARSPALRDDPEVLDIEAGWADNVLARADKETDIAARRTLLSSVAQDSTVDAARRRNAADKLKEAEYLGTDIRELPPAGGSSQGADPPPRPSRPVLAADPWGGTGARGASTPVDTAKVSELALQGREGEARARSQLEPRVWSGRATVDEIRMLRAICKHMGDRACSDRATALLAAQK